MQNRNKNKNRRSILKYDFVFSILCKKNIKYCAALKNKIELSYKDNDNHKYETVDSVHRTI